MGKKVTVGKCPTIPRRGCSPSLLQLVYMCVYQGIISIEETTIAVGNIASTPHDGLVGPQCHREMILIHPSQVWGRGGASRLHRRWTGCCVFSDDFTAVLRPARTHRAISDQLTRCEGMSRRVSVWHQQWRTLQVGAL